MASTATSAHSTSALFAHLGRITRQSAERALAPFDLRPRHLVTLTVLEEHGDESQQSLAAAVRIDPTNLVGLLNELESADLLVRRRDPADRRRHIVAITEHGRETLERVRAALGEAEDQLLAMLDADEREHLFQLLQRVSAGFVSDRCTTSIATAACAEADGRECEESAATADDGAECTGAIDAVTRSAG